MKFLSLVLKSARRSKRRTALTVLSVAIAVFLFASLRAVLDGFNAGAAASSSTRIVTQRSTSLFFSMPISHAEVIKSTPGVQDVTWANWFGGVYKDPQNFFAQFAVEPESYLRIYPEILLTPEEKRAFLEDRTGCIVGEGLARNYRFRIGDKITLQVGIPIYGTQDFDFTVRGIYRSGGGAVDNQSMLFQWKYADERSVQKGQAGWYVAQISNPDQAAQISGTIDQKFANSPFETKTDTEKAFQATFVSMFGNINLLLGSVAVAVVITTLFVAGNTMAMSVRERTREIGVLKTLGFPRGRILKLLLGESVLLALLGGIPGMIAAFLVTLALHESLSNFVPGLSVTADIYIAALVLMLALGLITGIIPAVNAMRLRIATALGRA